MEHRQEQIKAEEIKLRSMQQQIERLEGDISFNKEEINRLTEENRQRLSELEDASALLKDRSVPSCIVIQTFLGIFNLKCLRRETLEDAVRKQHNLIEKQSEELKALKRQMEDRDASLEKAK